MKNRLSSTYSVSESEVSHSSIENKRRGGDNSSSGGGNGESNSDASGVRVEEVSKVNIHSGRWHEDWVRASRVSVDGENS